jgi:hypothetical protein
VSLARDSKTPNTYAREMGAIRPCHAPPDR